MSAVSATPISYDTSWKIFPVHHITSQGQCSCGKPECWERDNGKPKGPAGKHPRTKHGVKDASSDPAVIDAWMKKYPGCNWAVATGITSGFFVLDVDGEAGSQSMRSLVRLHGRFPDTRMHVTGSGGSHFLFRCPDGLRIPNSCRKLGPGLDIRGEGGYIVLPPSNHWSGGAYAVVDAASPIADAPQWLLDLIISKPVIAPVAASPEPAPLRLPDEASRGMRYAAAAFDAEIRSVRSAREGTRNDTLNTAAIKLASLVAAGYITDAVVRQGLTQAALDAGLALPEITATINSGFRKGLESPRSLPPSRSASSPGPRAVPQDEPPYIVETFQSYDPDTGEVFDAPPPDDAPPPAPSEDSVAIQECVTRFNSRYTLVNEAGRAVIYEFRQDHTLNRTALIRIMPSDLHILYANDLVQVGVKNNGEPRLKPSSMVWMSHPQRKQYIGGVVFDPQRRHRADELNLWRGWAIPPAPGKWDIFRDHIRNVVCHGNPVLYDYLIRWIAHLFQRPSRLGEVAVVMKGKEGTGKGTVAKVIMQITGQHGISVNNSKHLVGNFNGHIRDAIFLFADEAFFAGDKPANGVLKNIITEPIITIEEKFRTPIQAPNYLHIMMASNEQWVVPAGMDSRRFFVLDVPDFVRRDTKYFGAMFSELEAGGYAGFLHDMLALDLSDFSVYDFPHTEALSDQRKRSLGLNDLWWQDVLSRGYVYQSRCGLEDQLGCWMEDVTCELLYGSYKAFAKDRGARHYDSLENLLKHLQGIGYLKGPRSRTLPTGEAHGQYGNPARLIYPKNQSSSRHLGTLDEAREVFSGHLGMTFNWD